MPQDQRNAVPIDQARAEELAWSEPIPTGHFKERERHLWGEFTQAAHALAAECPWLLDRAMLVLVQLEPTRKKWPKLERRIEGWVQAHPEWPPKRLAYYAQHYCRFDLAMMPFLIKQARRVKKKLYVRQLRAQRRKENAPLCQDEPMP